MNAPEAELRKSPNPTAAELLVIMMSDISEEAWCAGWKHGCEYDIWKIAIGEKTTFGQWDIPPEIAAKLKRLASECRGWWCWDDGPVFVSLSDWQRKFEEGDRP
ncbi:MAG: hypothetical protein HY785_24780 [Oscillatoriophycideae cyanobacterium NC_groundwater_1537_Pr4_S-0.65um_50_18]|nr:hypothetical protein [Oscillatoriophycideae cyanobacterium NC_groundwater_1537_Pr4_S-0.65um_50_18]